MPKKKNKLKSSEAGWICSSQKIQEVNRNYGECNIEDEES